MREHSQFILAPRASFVDRHFLADDFGRSVPFAEGEVQHHDQHVGNFEPDLLDVGIDNLRDFPVNLEEDGRIGAFAKGLVSPIMNAQCECVDVSRHGHLLNRTADPDRVERPYRPAPNRST